MKSFCTAKKRELIEKGREPWELSEIFRNFPGLEVSVNIIVYIAPPPRGCKLELSCNGLASLQGYPSVILVTLAPICNSLSKLAFQGASRITYPGKS